MHGHDAHAVDAEGGLQPLGHFYGMTIPFRWALTHVGLEQRQIDCMKAKGPAR